MILDQLQRADVYASLGERFARGFTFLRRPDLAELPPGRHEIDGQDLYATIMEVDLKTPAEGFWEAHRRYADIQFLLSGTERMGIADISALRTSKPYDQSGDVEIFTGTGQSILVPPGHFTIFLPHDAHMPGLRPDAEAARVKKVVVKVRLP